MKIKLNWVKSIIFIILVIIIYFFMGKASCWGPPGFLSCLNIYEKIIYVALAPFIVLAEQINGQSLIYLFTTIILYIIQIIYIYIIANLISLIFRRKKI